MCPVQSVNYVTGLHIVLAQVDRSAARPKASRSEGSPGNARPHTRKPRQGRSWQMSGANASSGTGVGGACVIPPAGGDYAPLILLLAP